MLLLSQQLVQHNRLCESSPGPSGVDDGLLYPTPVGCVPFFSSVLVSVGSQAGQFSAEYTQPTTIGKPCVPLAGLLLI